MKRIASLIVLAFISIVVLSPNIARPEPCGLPGDINSDGRVGLDEAVYILQVLAGIRPEFPDTKILFFTFNKQGCDGYPGNLFLYNTLSRTMDTVKDNCLDANGGSVNTDKTLIVYAEGPAENTARTIKIYDINSKATATIGVDLAEGAAVFNQEGKVLFIDFNTGVLKKMETNGTSIITVATPEAPYAFRMFWISPNLQKIAIVEEGGGNARLILMNSDGTNRSVIKADYTGSWNNLAWKVDSSGFLYFHHVYADFVKYDKYLLADLSTTPATTTDLSSSDLGKPENPCAATISGNFLGFFSRELYNGQTGALISDLSCTIPNIVEGMFGFGIGSDGIYFADMDGSHVRLFIE